MTITEAEFAQAKEELKDKLDDPDRAVKKYDDFTFGERVRLLEDNEEEGVFAGEEGRVIIEQLGSEEHGSLRTAVFLVAEGFVDPVEITGLEVESA